MGSFRPAERRCLSQLLLETHRIPQTLTQLRALLCTALNLQAELPAPCTVPSKNKTFLNFPFLFFFFCLFVLFLFFLAKTHSTGLAQATASLKQYLADYLSSNHQQRAVSPIALEHHHNLKYPQTKHMVDNGIATTALGPASQSGPRGFGDIWALSAQPGPGPALCCFLLIPEPHLWSPLQLPPHPAPPDGDK